MQDHAPQRFTPCLCLGWTQISFVGANSQLNHVDMFVSVRLSTSGVTPVEGLSLLEKWAQTSDVICKQIISRLWAHAEACPTLTLLVWLVRGLRSQAVGASFQGEAHFPKMSFNYWSITSSACGQRLKRAPFIGFLPQLRVGTRNPAFQNGNNKN